MTPPSAIAMITRDEFDGFKEGLLREIDVHVDKADERHSEVMRQLSVLTLKVDTLRLTNSRLFGWCGGAAASSAVLFRLVELMTK